MRSVERHRKAVARLASQGRGRSVLDLSGSYISPPPKDLRSAPIQRTIIKAVGEPSAPLSRSKNVLPRTGKKYSRKVRALALFIIPILAGQPIFRAYADEVATPVTPQDTVVSLPSSEPIPDAGAPDASADVTGEIPQEGDETGTVTQSVEGGTETLPEESALPESDGVASTSTEEVPSGEVGTDTPQETGGESVDSNAADGNGGGGSVSDASADDGSGSSLPNDGGADGDVLGAAGETEDTVNESSDSATVDPSSLSVDEVSLEDTTESDAAALREKEEADARIAEEARQRRELEKANLRREIEAEFTKGCTTVDETGYYCLKAGTQPPEEKKPAELMSVTVENIDGRGKEIVVTKGAKRIPITNNTIDDAFPALDISGTHVVWQGMVGGRWQIFTATIASDTPLVVQVTNATESNFNAKTDGGAIVWQSWIDDNWEIMLATPHAGTPIPRESLSPENVLVGVNGEWDVRRLTTNNEHDMFPSIAGTIITWQAFDGDNWVIAAYDMVTGITTHLSDGTKKAEKPRFALLWDERGDDGGARVMGYNVGSGEVFDVTAEAKRVPDDGLPTFPATPVSAPDQAALPVTAGSVAGGSLQKDDGNGGGDGGDDSPPDEDVPTSSDGAQLPSADQSAIASSSDALITPVPLDLSVLQSSTSTQDNASTSDPVFNPTVL